MANDKTSLAFNCPNCGAPLTPETGARTIKCKYCESTVTVPKSMRVRSSQPKASQAQVPPIALFGRGAGIFSILSMGRWIIFAISMSPLLILGCLAMIFFNLFNPFPQDSKFTPVNTATAPRGFATSVLTFGSEGIGPGMFSAAYSMAIADNGNLIVGDDKDGRVQTFDPSGKFISTFSIGGDSGVESMVMGQNGNIYLVHGRGISVYDSSGREINTIGADKSITALAIGADGKLYAFNDYVTIDRFDANGQVDLEIPAVFVGTTGETESDAHIAVDGLGNIYAVGTNQCTVVKYSPDGKFMDQFGGCARSSGRYIDGTIFSPSGIAVDGYGRVFVSDWNSQVVVFNSNGIYLNSIDANALDDKTTWGVYVDAQNNVYVTEGDRIQKFEIQKPE